jgi:acyl carrier protein
MQVKSSNSNLNELEAVQTWLVNKLSEQLSLEPTTVSITEPLTRYGLDSIDAVTMVGELEDWLDLELPSTLFWDSPTIEKAAKYLEENFDLSSALTNETDAPVKEEVVASTSKGWGGLFGRK